MNKRELAKSIHDWENVTPVFCPGDDCDTERCDLSYPGCVDALYKCGHDDVTFLNIFDFTASTFVF